MKIFAYNFKDIELCNSFHRYVKNIIDKKLEFVNNIGAAYSSGILCVYVCIDDDIGQLHSCSCIWKENVYWFCIDKLEVILKLYTDRNRIWDIKTWEKIIENRGWKVVIFPWNFKDLVHFKRRNHEEDKDTFDR